MSAIIPLSFERHGSRYWQRFKNYSFTACKVVAPLAAAEVSKAALVMPLAFMMRGSGCTLGAVLGLSPEQNLFVDKGGRWTGSYIPAAFRGHPFSLKYNQTGQVVFCIDEASGLVSDADGEPIFNNEKELSAGIQQLRDFLLETARSEAALNSACNLLHAAGVIEPWPVTIQDTSEKRQVTGLHRINETALNALDDATFIGLRRASVLGLAYAQLLSMGMLVDLGRRCEARAQLEVAKRAETEVKPMVMLPDDSTIDWDWSKVGKS